MCPVFFNKKGWSCQAARRGGPDPQFPTRPHRKVFDQDINIEKVKFDTKLDALFLVVELPESPAEEVKRVPVPVQHRTRSEDDLEFHT